MAKELTLAQIEAEMKRVRLAMALRSNQPKVIEEAKRRLKTLRRQRRKLDPSRKKKKDNPSPPKKRRKGSGKNKK